MTENAPITQDNDPLAHLNRKSRRARLASLFTGLPGVLAGGATAATAYEASHVQPADAAIEQTTTHEGQSPQAFINTFNHNFAAAAQHMESSPHFKTLTSSKINKLTKSKAVFKIISLPSKEAGKFDILDVAMNGKQPIPDSAEIFIGADSPSVQNVKTWEHAYNVVTTAGLGLGKWLAYEQDNGPSTVSNAENIFVSTGGYSGVSPDHNHIFYSQKNAQQVSDAYNGFLKRMHDMTAQK